MKRNELIQKMSENNEKMAKDSSTFQKLMMEKSNLKFNLQLKRLDYQQYTADNLSMNPLDLLKFLYVINGPRIFLRANINGKTLEELDFEKLESYLSIDILNRMTELYNFITKQEDDYILTEVCERLIDSSDLNLVFDVYDYDTEYFDMYTYGDVYKISNKASTPEFLDFFASVLSMLDEEILFEEIDKLLEEF